MKKKHSRMSTDIVKLTLLTIVNINDNCNLIKTIIIRTIILFLFYERYTFLNLYSLCEPLLYVKYLKCLNYIIEYSPLHSPVIENYCSRYKKF